LQNANFLGTIAGNSQGGDKSVKRRHLPFALAGLASLRATAAQELVIAQVAPMTGPLGVGAQANYVGAKAWFDSINDAGGVHGARIRLVQEDDQYKPQETIRLLELVAQRDKPLAFINMYGSANVAAVLNDKVLDRLRTPVIGVTPGAESLRKPGSPWVFHVQAGDRAQIRKILAHLSTTGISRVAVVYQDNPFGKNGLAFADELAGPMKIQIVGRVSVPSAADDLKAAAAELKKTNAQTYLMVLASNSGASLVRDVRQAADATPIYGMSYVDAAGVVAKAPSHSATGVALAQIAPGSALTSTALTRDFQRVIEKYAPPGTERTQLHLVGFIAARVTTEALLSAGPSPTPERVAQALHKLRKDLGGYFIDFSGNDNVGSNYVDIAVIDERGRLMW
jgi:ABC-type branched-subunit amino acid transport system substrate-binding protein